MALQGIPSTSPIPRRARQFKPASGSGIIAGNSRPVVLVGNKLAAGTETVETLGSPISSLQDCYNRFGQRSEIAWMYRAYTAVDQQPLLYAIAVAEGGGASASTCNFAFASAATVQTVVNIDSVKGRLQVGVSVGDAITTIATNVAAAINGDPDLPFSAAVDSTATTVASGSNGQALPQSSISVASTTGFPSGGGTVLIGSINQLVTFTGTSGGNTLTGCSGGTGTLATGQTVTLAGQVDITTSQKGPRSKYWIAQLRMSFADPTNATTITKSAVTAGTTADSVANAITAADTSTFTYHCLAMTATSSVTANDGGLGQYFTYLASALSPTNGKNSMGIFAVDGTPAQATAVTQSAVVNTAFGHCYRVKNNDWHPAMVSAHHTAIHRSQEVNYAAANLAGWTNQPTLGQVYLVPDPFTKTDRPTQTDMTTDLNGGVSTVGFRTDGTPYIVRSITTYSWIGSSSTADYRAREGHIPSVMIKYWDDLRGLLIASNQPNVAADPPQGGKRIPGFMYPSTAKSIATQLIRDMCGSYQDNKALLDPSVLTQMLAGTTCTLGAAGFEIDAAIAAVRHNLFDDALISEIGPAY